MSRNGSGVYSLPKPPFVPGTTISSADVNSDLSDIATAITGSVAADGQTPITAPLKFPDGTALRPSQTFSSDVSTGMYLSGTAQVGISAGGVEAIFIDNSSSERLTYGDGARPNPVGSVSVFAGPSVPTGWFLCYGQAVSRSTYVTLFTAVGTTYGSGDGTSTFNLPDLRGRAPFGKDDMGGVAAGRITTAGSGFDGVTLGAVGGSQNLTLITANLPAYTPSGSVGVSDSRTWITNNALVPAAAGPGNIGAGANVGLAAQQPVSVNGGSISGSFTGAAQGGVSTPAWTISPGMIMNYIIFAGKA